MSLRWKHKSGLTWLCKETFTGLSDQGKKLIFFSPANADINSLTWEKHKMKYYHKKTAISNLKKSKKIIKWSNQNTTTRDEEMTPLNTTWLKLTSRSCTSAFTFLDVSGEGELWDASLMRVARKFLHFFTFSCISWKENSGILQKIMN